MALTRLAFTCLPILFLLLAQSSSAQINDAKSNLDSSKTISKVAFDNLVNNCIDLLQTKELADISDTEHINIMMCLNTILKLQLDGGRYKKLVTVSDEKKYTADIIKIYPDWIPNRGMGFYFPKLKMELYGTPRLYAIFNVTE